jgi:hypothetical protein
MIILGVNPLLGRRDVRSKNYERGDNDMDSIFFKKDEEYPVADREKSMTKPQEGMRFALFSALLLMFSVFLPFYGNMPSEPSSYWASLIELGYVGYAVFALGFLAFVLNCYRKHGVAAICGGFVLLFWLCHFISRTLDTIFKSEYRYWFFWYGSGWGDNDTYRHVRMIGYWVLPIAAGLVVYFSLALWKKNRKQKNVEEQEV